MFKKAPSIFNIDYLSFQIKKDHTFIDGKWHPSRPVGLFTILNRLRAAWLVFSGKGDVVLWYRQ